MNIGLLRCYYPALAEDLTRWGFRSVELEVREGGPLDPATANKHEMVAAVESMREQEIEVAALAYYGNLLEPTLDVARERIERLYKMIESAHDAEVGVLGIMAGRDPSLSPLDNLPQFVRIFAPIVQRAETLGIKLAIENCPKFHKFPFRSTNFAFSMASYDAIFAALPSPYLGMEYDPSHPVMMLMDYVAWIHHFGSRIFHVHAKDAEVVWPEIQQNGIYADGAFRYRLPGMGDVNWGRVVSALIEIGYRGPLNIEGQHDPVYADEFEEPGLLLARRHLEQFVPSTPIAHSDTLRTQAAD